jgi:hypothetical protein
MTRTTILSLLLVLGLVTGACSSGAEDGTVASLGADAGGTEVQSAEAESIPAEEAVLAFAACLRDEGLDIDDPDIDAEGNLVAPSMHTIGAETLDMSAVHSAFDACRGFLDSVAFGLSSEDLTGREDELLAFAVCMRENGYDMPDPDFSGEGHSGAGPFGDAIDTDDPDFLTAVKSCESIVGG